MKQIKKKTTKKLIGLDNRYNTNWNALLILAAISFLSGTTFYALSQESEYIYYAEASESSPGRQNQAKIVQIITNTEYEAIQSKEAQKQAHLAKLRTCESQNDDGAIGDAGKSVGPYQWQKATLEDKLGRKVTNKEWLELATDYEFIHELTYKTYFEDGEWWRWYNCSVKLGYNI